MYLFCTKRFLQIKDFYSPCFFNIFPQNSFNPFQLKITAASCIWALRDTWVKTAARKWHAAVGSDGFCRCLSQQKRGFVFIFFSSFNREQVLWSGGGFTIYFAVALIILVFLVFKVVKFDRFRKFWRQDRILSFWCFSIN